MSKIKTDHNNRFNQDLLKPGLVSATAAVLCGGWPFLLNNSMYFENKTYVTNELRYYKVSGLRTVFQFSSLDYQIK